jgi:predicted nucleic acid-binding protein
MRIYLDNCCFNRPYDDQTQIRIRIESEAKLFIQAKVLAGEIELAWSYILDYENSANPFLERRLSIAQWKTIAVVDVIESPSILKYAQQLESRGLRGKDALHIACALETGCECLLTTDDQIVKIMDNDDKIRVVNPTVFVTTMEPYS